MRRRKGTFLGGWWFLFSDGEQDVCKLVGTMKKGIHPEYRLVVFKDVATGKTFLTRSSVQTKETIRWVDGKEYPLYKMEVSRYSHPFFTGQMRYVDTAGRVEKFMRRYKQFYAQQGASEQKEEAVEEGKTSS